MHSRAVIFEYYCKLVAVWSVVVIVVSSIVYVVFLLLAVQRTNMRTQSEARSKEVSSELGSVQAQYLVATQSATPERATALGLVQPLASSVIYIDTATQAFSTEHGHVTSN